MSDDMQRAEDLTNILLIIGAEGFSESEGEILAQALIKIENMRSVKKPRFHWKIQVFLNRLSKQ